MKKDVEFIVRVIADSVLENEAYFSELDGVVGDGDFGYSIARGFEKVLQEWDNLDHSTPGNFLKKISSTFASTVECFELSGVQPSRSGMAMGTKTEFTHVDSHRHISPVTDILKEANRPVIRHTDAMVNALEASWGKEREALHDAAIWPGTAEGTRKMIAKRGRHPYRRAVLER
jgi:dihydroxyacetone kinase/dihydroxyacetone kinase-like protein